MSQDIAGEIGESIEARVEEQHVETTFSTDMDEPEGLIRVLETENYTAQIKFLRYPDTNEPFDNPWHVKVTGAVSGVEGWRQGAVWSNSYDSLDAAVGAATSQLQKAQRRFDRRNELMHEEEQAKVASKAPSGVRAQFSPGDHVGYAVFDTKSGGFKRSGMFGQVIFESVEEAREAAGPGMFVLELEVEQVA